MILSAEVGFLALACYLAARYLTVLGESQSFFIRCWQEVF